MSGSGGGGGGGEWRPKGPAEGSDQKTGASGGDRGGTSGDACDISEVTTLNSPNRTTVSTLRVGDVLDIELRLGPPRQLLAMRTSEVAGSITSPKSAQIIQCISRQGRS